jgi:hypothetical protein
VYVSRRDDDWLEVFLARARSGELPRCALCGTPAPAGQLTETTVPGYLITGWDIMVGRVIFVCPACPVP